MHVAIDPRANAPIYVQIMDEIRRLIAIGELAADDPLPSVRALAAALRINHNTIVQAYRELERDGAIYVRRGQGTFVATQVQPQAERAKLLSEVASRATTDAHRHGFTRNELIGALQAAPDKQGGSNE